MRIEEEARKLIFQLWQFYLGKRKMIPLPTPSSLMRTDLKTLKNTDYLVTYKNDGVREILLFGFTEKEEKDFCVFMQRNGKCKTSPFASRSPDVYMGTIFDGELVEKDFVIFDVVTVNGISCASLPLRERLKMGKSVLPFITAKQGFNLFIKEFYDSDESEHVFKSFENDAALRSGKYDGIILAPSLDSVGVGRLMRYFKYKPTTQTTIDLSWCRKEKLLRCGSPGFEILEDAIPAISWNLEDFLQKKDGVYECVISQDLDDADNTILSPKIKREDKDSANSKYVVLRTFQNLQENIKPMEVFCSLKKKV
tara:strand:+ start:528 stop:1457 length:930 start_codon:yes stop_codon:yes gene_type:complete